MKKINESATSGSTSAGAIANVSTGLNHSMIKRMPPTNIFGGYSTVPDQKKMDTTKKNGK